ncbi:adenylate kinase [Candidatus Bathyarchaeota archaeon]|nr:adenylate kinase [Candidatus Bathyarchaeota archaeon]
MQGKVIVVTGIPGVGKSTVLNELVKLADQSSRKITVINYGTVMLEIAEKIGATLSRDEIRKSSLEFQQRLQAEAARKISQEATKTQILIVDTHMIIRTPSGFWPGLPNYVLNKLKPELLVLIEADAEEILARRSSDRTRIRDKILIDEVVEELSFSRSVASACATLTGAPVKVIRNPVGKQLEAAKELLQLL